MRPRPLNPGENAIGYKVYCKRADNDPENGTQWHHFGRVVAMYSDLRYRRVFLKINYYSGQPWNFDPEHHEVDTLSPLDSAPPL